MSRGGCWDLCHWSVTPSPSVEPRGGRGGMEASPHGAALPELRLDPRRVTRLEPPLPLPGEPRALNGAAPPTPHGSPRGPAPRPGGRSQGAGHRPAGNRNRRTRLRVSAPGAQGNAARFASHGEGPLPMPRGPHFPCARDTGAGPAQACLFPRVLSSARGPLWFRAGRFLGHLENQWSDTEVPNLCGPRGRRGAGVRIGADSWRRRGSPCPVPAVLHWRSAAVRLPVRTGNAGCGEHGVRAGGEHGVRGTRGARAAAASPQAPPPRARSPHVLSAAWA